MGNLAEGWKEERKEWVPRVMWRTVRLSQSRRGNKRMWRVWQHSLSVSELKVSVRWDQSTTARHQPQPYLRRFVPSLLFEASVTCCLRMLSSSAFRSRPGQAQILASKHRRPNTWPLGEKTAKVRHNLNWSHGEQLLGMWVSLTLWFPEWRWWESGVYSFHPRSSSCTWSCTKWW